MYHIAENFGGGNVAKVDLIKILPKKFGKDIARSAKSLLIVTIPI